MKIKYYSLISNNIPFEYFMNECKRGNDAFTMGNEKNHCRNLR